MGYWDTVDVSVLVGQTVKEIRTTGQYDDEIRFTLEDGRELVMGHVQDCCESVVIEEIIGDLDDLVGSPILVAEERCSSDDEKYGDPERTKDGWGYDSVTWTFYELRTNKGSVTIRWCGESNGYYSESVDCWYA